MPDVSHRPTKLSADEAWRAIATLARDLSALTDVEERYAHLHVFCRRLWGLPEAQFFPIGRNLTDMADRPGKGVAAFLEYVAKLEGPIMVGGVEVEDLQAHQSLPALLLEPAWKTFMLAPVRTPGRAVGVLALADDLDGEFGPEDVAMLDAVVAQLATVLDTAILAEENRYKDAYSRALGEIDAMIASYDVTESLRVGVRKVYETIEAEKVLVFTVNPDSGVVRLSVAEGCPHAREGTFVHEPCAKLAMQTLSQRRLQIVGEAELRALPGVKLREACTEKQAIAVPIMANGNCFGVLEVFEKKNGKPFHRNEVAFITQVATKLALVIQNTQAYLTINRLNESLEVKVSERTSQLEQAITTLKDTQAQLMQSEKLATIGTLAGGVAHELNNPMSAILANVQLLQLDVEDPEQRESLEMIESGARRCKQIVENLLNYSRQATPEQRSLSINAVLNDTLGLLRHQLRNANVEIILQLGELPPVLGNANELSQIFTNMAVNAMDAIADRHRTPAVGHLTIRTYQDGKTVVVEFTDDGCGMDELTMRKIFDPFFTTKQIGKGTGLGLSVSQQIASAHGGRIEATSVIGEGSAMRVVLPVAHGAAGMGPR
jgi:signal transduction histidine kinase